MKEYIKRYCILIVGLFIMALGVALSTRANLGTSPVSCVPYVLSLKLPFTMGNITIAMHILFILIQILLLRKEFELIQLLQLVVAVIFGYFTDFTLWMLSGITVNGYVMQWALCLVSCVIIAFGVSLEVQAGVILLAGEGVMTAIAKVFHVEFGKVKMGFDCTQVIIGVSCSFLMLHKLEGIREGTIAAAILVGLLVRLYRRMGLDLEKHFASVPEEDEKETTYVITIAREAGSGGHEIGVQLSERLNIPFYDKEMIELEAKESGFSEEFVKRKEQNLTNSLLYDLYTQSYEYVHGERPQQEILFETQKKIIKEKAKKESCIIVGRLGGYILREKKKCFRVLIHGDQEYRIERYKEQYSMKEQEARSIVARIDEERENHHKYFTRTSLHDAKNYDLAINTKRVGIDQAVRMILEATETIRS